MSKLILLKLLSGEEIVGEEYNRFDHTIGIKIPLVLMVSRTTANQQAVNVQLVPYSIFSDDKEPVRFRYDVIVSISTPNENLISSYDKIVKAAKTGLILPTSPAINTPLKSVF